MPSFKSKLIATAIVIAAPLILVVLAGNPSRPAQAGVVGEPQLFPSWTSVRAKCTGKKKKTRCRITGEFSVVNDGDAPSGPCKVDIWVSKNDVLEEKVDVKVKTFNVDNGVPAGLEVPFEFSFSTPRGTKVLRRHLIAVVDPDNEVSESDETDNEEAIGPLH
jgi:hypothetical protein